MSRLLPRAAVSARPRIVGADGPVFPEDLRRLVDAEVQAAHERGRADGFAAGRASVEEEWRSMAEAVRVAVREGLEALRGWREADAADLLAAAVEIARRVCSRAAPMGDDELAAGLRSALEALDDAPLEAIVHPSRAERLTEALAGQGVQVRGDGSLGPDDVVVQGPWSRLELTAEAVWTAVAEALGVSDPEWRDP